MAYSELIKNFQRIRDYMRQFYVYGFKSRTEYDKKSARSYDNERRRIESWLGNFMRFRQTPEEMPFSVVKKGTYHECNMLLCRIPFWRKRKVSKMEDAVKTYCAQKAYLYYEKLCMHFFLEEPNAVEFM